MCLFSSSVADLLCNSSLGNPQQCLKCRIPDRETSLRGTNCSYIILSRSSSYFSIRPLLEPYAVEDVSESVSAESDGGQMPVFVPQVRKREGHYKLKAASATKVFVRNLDFQVSVQLFFFTIK